MNFKKLELAGLELVDPNADYSGTQTIFIDFDGAENVSYDNEALGIYIDNISVMHSGLSEQKQFEIITELNNSFAETGVTFTKETPEKMKYSSIYIGEVDAFAEYAAFAGLAETIDVANQLQDDNAFVFTDKFSSNKSISSTIVHEAAHLLGFQHSEAGDNLAVSSYALAAATQVTLQIVNNFASSQKSVPIKGLL